jgi:drug/metabolite transporter (DMT)-like permease
MWGDLLTLFSAVMYGLYTTLIRKNIPDEDSVSVSLFFGYMGVINMCIVSPFVIVAWQLGIEDLSKLTLKVRCAYFMLTFFHLLCGTFFGFIFLCTWEKIN